MSSINEHTIDLTDQHTSRRLSRIEARHLRVEAEKSWETSAYRRGLILVSTFVVVFLYNLTSDVSSPWLSALVAAVGVLASSMTFTRLRKRFVNHRVLDR